jgi:regulator of protease activity HflC (stomatin/prohibitin superfamily)
VMKERQTEGLPGLPMLLLLLAAAVGCGYQFVQHIRRIEIVAGISWLGVAIVALVFLGGLFVVNPNEARVLQLFGSYRGTAKIAGLRWANPFYSARRVSMRVRNFETAKLKVNDKRGNPIEIAAVVVWRVVDSAEALFEVDNFEDYVRVQSEAAVRNLASSYPYDAHGAEEVDLVSHTAEVSGRLRHEIHERLAQAGVEVPEARISHLAYAPEIAAAMLQRQQASAVVAARQKIVEGAVGMVQMALDELALKNVVEFDDDRRAAMVSNLLVVLCSDRHTQPVVNTGTLHH